jgi:hypothetical protein
MTIMEKVIKDNQESMKSLFANISIWTFLYKLIFAYYKLFNL